MTASPTPFFAESAGEPDHSGDANKMVPAGLPSEEIRRIIDDAMNSAIPETWEVSAHATARIYALFAPILAEKEARIRELAMQVLADDQQLTASLDRALAAEAALGSLRQAILDADIICDDDEKAGDRLSRLATAIRSQEQPPVERGK